MTGEADLRLADARAREAAQTVFDRPLVLTAGAGTGKTSALVARIVAWCTGPGWERAAAAVEAPEVAARVLRRVVAITFTEAAAAEMAERVGQALAGLEAGRIPEGVLEAVLPADPATRSARARALLESLDQLVVRTIHAWCRRLLAAYPLEARVHPAFEIDADESVRADVVREALERSLREEWADGSDAVFADLARAGIGPDVLERVLHEALTAGLPTEALDEDPFNDERVAEFRAGLGTAVDAFEAVDRGRMAQAKKVKRGVAVQQALDATRQALGALDSASGLAACAAALREAWSGGQLDTLRDWSRGTLRKGETAIVGGDAGAYAGVADPLRARLKLAVELDPARFRAIRRALAPLVRRVRSELRTRGVESYDGLLENAARLLEQPGPRARIRAGLDQLLVDEFQDTDRTQCRILRSLALDGDPESRPGLFLVGDPKQSIYGWRSADLAAYEDFVSRVLDAGGESCHLALNFRSVPAILDEVERVMRPAMRYAPGMQPEFASLVPTVDPVDPEARDGRPAVEYWVSWDRRDPAAEPGPLRAAEAAEAEARALASDLSRLRDEGTSLGGVGLLFRGRSDFDVYLAALRAADIPYSVEGDRGFYRRREIIEASALVRAVIDPHDSLSLLTWLRSASVGVPDAALLPLWREQLPSLCADLPDARMPSVVAQALERVPSDVPGLERIRGWDRSLVDALDALGALRESFASDTPDVFVEKLRARTAIEATESARFLGAYRLANLDRFFRELIARLEAGDRDPQAVLRGLRTSLRIGQEEEEGRSLAPEGEAVRVLTIHRAKGLDFEHVYLLQAHRETGSRGAKGPFGGECDGRWEYRLDGAPTLGFAQVLERVQRVAEAEQVRTLYVALTRAKRRLVVAASWPAAGAEPKPGSFLSQLAGRSEGVPALEAFVADRLQAGSSGAVQAGAYWRVPALDPAAPPPAAA
ncbi:MAG: UvrD-helicase domain-containing protein, partial [Deltaproteobacteria bacterium]|nr:UvrD-helicase domain-containing protein [Deltaproteobacteria bacterium]